MWLLHVSNFLKAKLLWNSLKHVFDISKLFIQCNTHSCCEYITGSISLYLYGCVSLLAPVLCVYVCKWYQIRVLVKNHTMCQTTVNLMRCCIKHTTRSFWYCGNKAWQVHNIIKYYNTSNVAHSPIQPTKQGNKKK